MATGWPPRRSELPVSRSGGRGRNIPRMTASIAAIAALVGVILGQLLSRGGEFRKWLRAERHSACVRLLEAAEELSMLSRVERSLSRLAQKRGVDITSRDSIRSIVRAMIKESDWIRT